MMKKTLMICSFILFAFFVKAEKAEEGIKFFKGTFEEALAKAKVEKKLVFVDYWATW